MTIWIVLASSLSRYPPNGQDQSSFGYIPNLWEKSKALRKVLAKLTRQLRPQAHAYVEAFGISTVLRNAEIVG